MMNRSEAARKAAATRRANRSDAEYTLGVAIEAAIIAEASPAPHVKVKLVRDSSVPARKVTSPAAAVPMLRELFDGLDREHFVVVLLDVRHGVIACNTVSVGSVSSTLVHPREVFKPALIAGASAILVSHNHPTGDPEPSAEDLVVTKRLTAAGTLLGVEVLDHIIIGNGTGRWVSLKDRGML